MLRLVLIAFMGGIGSVARYLLITGVQRQSGSSFPLGTLCVNVAGCLCIGALVALCAGRFPIREDYRLALTAGLLGGFTTFSAFGLETFELLRSGRSGQALVYSFGSLTLGLLAVWLGYRLGQIR